MTDVLRLKNELGGAGIRHRMLGPALAARWCRQENPPLGAAQAVYYAAALETELGPETRARVERCLLLCHAETGAVDPARAGWYRDVARAHLDDDRCAFFLAALCRQGIVRDEGAAEEAYRAVLAPERAGSPLWSAFELSPVALRAELALLCARSDTVTDERLSLVETAYRRPGARPEERDVLTGYLARAYRERGRADNDAVTVYTLRFTTHPEDAENLAYLARLWAAREQRDANACAAYLHMARNEPTPGDWTLRCARACIAIGRLNEETGPILRAAAAIAPEDAELAAALAWMATRADSPDPDERHALEEALRREGDVHPVFVRHRWEWTRALRAVARCWGVEGRLDEPARRLYKRVLALCPDDDDLVVAQARLLSAADEHTPETIPVYARALAALRAADAAAAGAERDFVEALGRGYLEAGDPEAARPIWEELYRQGCDWPELRLALARVWASLKNAPEAAAALWKRVVEEHPGERDIRLRLARALRESGDPAEALRHCRQAARLDPNCVEAYRETGRLLLETGDPYSAEIWLRGALALGDGAVETRFRLAEAVLAQDRRDEARALFQEINEHLDPGHTGTILRLVQLSRKAESGTDGRFPEIGDADADDPETYRALAARFRRDRRDAEEEKALRRLLELAPDDTEGGRSLAELLLRRGDAAGAESILRGIVASGRADRRCYALLGELVSGGRKAA